jgi:hypothetical protein
MRPLNRFFRFYGRFFEGVGEKVVFRCGVLMVRVW